MRIIAQIVENASLEIDKKVFSFIPKGLLLLVSFTTSDTPEIARKMADKISKMRVFPDEDGKTNLDILTFGGEILSVSQFTLYAEFSGRRPSFTKVLNGVQSAALYDIFNAALAQKVVTKTGVFGANMNITFTNCGPVTYLVEENE